MFSWSIEPGTTYSIWRGKAADGSGLTDAHGQDPVEYLNGAVALGHPLGATGAKLTVQLLHEMQASNTKYGMVTMCVGGGQGAAGIFELLN